MDDLFILVTGGTIDKVHDPVTEKLVFDGESRIAHIMKLCRVEGLSYDIIMLKDSLDMDDADRTAILDAVNERPERRIIITHGTGTMENTAAFLKGKTGDKIIILTGSMRPFSLLRSDAGFNMGGAIMAAQLAKPGVYIAMNGQLFEAGSVTKNRDTGFFSAVA